MDIKGKAVGWRSTSSWAARSKPVPAYAGGISLGYQPPDALAAEAVPMVEAGYKALKLRVGDTVKADIARMTAVRRRFGDEGRDPDRCQHGLLGGRRGGK